MSGNLYQLHCTSGLPTGACVFVLGPYDKFGVIVKATEKLRDGLRLYLIRGTGELAHDYPVHDTISFTDYPNGASIKQTCCYSDLFCDKCHREL